MAFKCEATPIFYCFLFLCSAISLILGALAWSHASSSFLPLPTSLPAIATLLSPITIISLIASNLFGAPGANRNTAAVNNFRQRVISITNQIHTIVCTIIATVVLTFLFPDNIFSCHIEEQWKSYYQSRNANAIRTIQDRYQCCGLRSIHDRAWPFKDRNHGDNACELQLGYPRSCFTPWGNEQRVASWMVVAAAVLIWVVKIGFVMFDRRQASWMSSHPSRGSFDYQRITHPEVRGEVGDSNRDESGELGGTLLPHERTTYPNEWQER